MGHQFPRAVVAGAVAFALAGCGGSDGSSDPPPVLEVAREQVADARADDSSDSESTDEAASGDAASAPAELPTPDPSSFVGAHRVVNLFADAGSDAGGAAIDVWGRRTFTNGPVLLAENVGFGEASDYFSVPEGFDLVMVGAGAGPDGVARAEQRGAGEGEQLTTVFTNGDDPASAVAATMYERGSERAPAPPGDGNGLVMLFAPNLPAFGDELTAAVGSQAFFVGDGSETCRTQRVESTGAAPEILGGDRLVEVELAPGPALISFHPGPFPEECDQPSTFDVTVDVIAGEITAVLVYTPDGVGIEALTLPVGR